MSERFNYFRRLKDVNEKPDQHLGKEEVDRFMGNQDFHSVKQRVEKTLA